MPYTLHVVSHTHWDREWYMPFEQFRLRLVDLVDRLLDLLESDEAFRHFSLDAQTIVLEDYLEVKPHQRERLMRHIREGKIGIGPWYQLNDEFLVSGEATIRSLLIGHRVAREFGDCMKVGYLPDQFGNISQMPQILRGFGIDNAIFGRGRRLSGDRKMEFWWEAPDGSRVLASLMAYWYNNAQYIPAEPTEAAAYLERLRDTMGAASAMQDLLLMNGVDHLEPQPWIGKTLAEAAPLLEARTGDRLLHSSLTTYVDAIRSTVTDKNVALETVRGELREDAGGACLAGTLSTRVYLKRANDAAQNELERYAEPLASFARLDGAAYPSDALRYAWKLLMQNHPHDSICGCSVDAVHEEMMTRFGKVLQVAEMVKERALDVLANRDRTTGAIALPCDLLVLNTLNWPRTDPVRFTLEIPLGPPARGNPQRDNSRLVRGLRLLDTDGSEMPFHVVAEEAAIVSVLNPLELPLDQWVQRLTVETVVRDVPACGYKRVRVEAVPQQRFRFGAPIAEEEFPAEWWDLPHLEDGGDAGDEYLYRAPMEDRIVEACLVTSGDVSRERSPVRATDIFVGTMEVPASSTSVRRSEHTVSMPVEIRRTVWSGVPRIEYRITVDNNAMDHRLQATFDAAGEVLAASPFDVVRRRLTRDEIEAGASSGLPMTLWLTATGDSESKGRLIAAPGLHEFEVREAPNGAVTEVALTLLRCVGQLSGRGDGPGIATPGAQCPGRHSFDLMTFEYCGPWMDEKVWMQAHQFATPLIAVQAPPLSDGVHARSYATVEPSSLILSALKQSEDGDTLILRGYNITDAPVPEARISLIGARSWRRVNLNEEPEGAWTEGALATLTVGPRQIFTLEFEV